MIKENEAIKQAEKAALKALLELTKESPKIYNSTGAIERRISKNSFYGNITPNDVPGLLEKYVTDLVTCIPTRQTNGRICKSYIANLKRESEIEKIIAEN